MKILRFLCVLFLLSSCKPSANWAVHWSTKHPAKYDTLTEHFVRAGGCKADTTTKTTQSDSVEYIPVLVHDTFLLSLPAVCNVDTVLPDGIKLYINDGKIVITLPSVSTIHYKAIYKERFIRDLTQENFLRGDSARLQLFASGQAVLLSDRERTIKEQGSNIHRLQTRFWGLIIVLGVAIIITLYLKIKPKFL